MAGKAVYDSEVIKVRVMYDLPTINGNIYKKIMNHLCDLSDTIYFTYYEDCLLNEEILELGGQCEKVIVSKGIRNQINSDTNIVGYRVDFFVKKYLLEKDSFADLMYDRGEYGLETGVLFYKGNDRIAYIELTDFRDICFETADEELIQELSTIGY